MASETDNPEQKDESRGLFKALLGGLGEPVTFAYSQMAGIFQTLMLTLHYTIRGRKRWGEILYQMYNIGNRSLLFISVVLGFLGMILIFQSATQTARITGDLQYLGAVFLQLLIREFVPTIGAMMLATRVGTGIAAEIGSMVVTEQVDALRMSAAQPIQYLIVPRFIACTIMSVILLSIGVGVAFLAGMLTANGYFEVNPRTFINLSFVKWDDVIVGLAKTVSYGMAIPIVSGQAGLAAFGGSEGVGWATTQAVVNASLAIVLLNFVISGLAYVVFPGV